MDKNLLKVTAWIMHFFSQQISPEKWGIYSDDGLLATVSCQVTCDTILANLQNGRRDTPTSELNALYQVPKLQKRPNPNVATNERRSNRPLVSTRKARKRKVSTADHAAAPTSAAPTSAMSTVAKATANASVDSKHQAHMSPTSELSDLQIQQIRVAQATGASSQTPQTKKAERA